ncbi:MAG: acyltransferase [Leptospiraceae bacterium]|nr:MAG: acyltransferase [Leptospiraceae bacterium]
MLFNSILYFIFFFIVYILYWNSGSKLRKYILIIASIVFYATWGLTVEGLIGIRWTVHFLSIIIFSHIINHLMFAYPEKKKYFLWILILVLLSNLSLFKYANFFIQFFDDLGISKTIFPDTTDIFLPLAISFYTFQIIAYSIDIYRGIIQEKRPFSDYFLFILFFPQLIAGPIMRYSDFFGQTPRLTIYYVYTGCWFIISGLIKKVLIADPMGTLIAPVFRLPETFEFYQILLAGAGFSIQVYCDFSGYTDIARGSAYLLGYEIPENFSAPFFSRSAREMWQRWHITLATWLRDYIYIPLGGSRISEVRTYINQIITFTLGGFWHGADYTYIAWGAMWGFLLAIERFFEKILKIKTVPEKNIILIILKILFIFYLFILGALMFRSHKVIFPDKEYRSVEIMGQLLKGSFINGSNKLKNEFLNNQGDIQLIESVMGKDFFSMNKIPYIDTFIGMVLLTLLFHWFQYKPEHFQKLRKYDFYLLVLAAGIICGILLPALAQTGHQFIYFVF